jgi:hypothetical protein
MTPIKWFNKIAIILTLMFSNNFNFTVKLDEDRVRFLEI